MGWRIREGTRYDAGEFPRCEEGNDDRETTQRPPHLVVEVMSPGDRWSKVLRRVSQFLKGASNWFGCSIRRTNPSQSIARIDTLRCLRRMRN